MSTGVQTRQVLNRFQVSENRPSIGHVNSEEFQRYDEKTLRAVIDLVTTISDEPTAQPLRDSLPELSAPERDNDLSFVILGSIPAEAAEELKAELESSTGYPVANLNVPPFGSSIGQTALEIGIYIATRAGDEAIDFGTDALILAAIAYFAKRRKIISILINDPDGNPQKRIRRGEDGEIIEEDP